MTSKRPTKDWRDWPKSKRHGQRAFQQTSGPVFMLDYVNLKLDHSPQTRFPSRCHLCIASRPMPSTRTANVVNRKLSSYPCFPLSLSKTYSHLVSGLDTIGTLHGAQLTDWDLLTQAPSTQVPKISVHPETWEPLTTPWEDISDGFCVTIKRTCG